MTALIDVVFLLLVFFLKAASVQTVEGVLPTYLPQQGQAAPELDPDKQDLEIVHIRMLRADAGVEIQLNEESYTLADVRGPLAQLQKLGDPPVFVDADADVKVGHVITIYDICKGVGLTRIAFAAPPRS